MRYRDVTHEPTNRAVSAFSSAGFAGAILGEVSEGAVAAPSD